MKFTPENITRLEHNQIFVFGSNTWGVHGKGAAKTARDLFGAQKGVAEGPTGQCYAIPTRKYIPRDEEHWKVRFEAVSLADIYRSIYRFADYASANLHKEFLVTKLGCGYAGYSPEDFIDIWAREEFPPNIILPVEFQPQ